MQNQKAGLFAATAVVVTTLLGAALGHFLGSPKAFFLIVIAMTAWLISGWFFGGLRTVLVGITALSAALSAAEGTYAVSALFFCISFFLLFADIMPRERQHSDSMHSKV
jgi:hypothetical protein